MAFMTKHEEKDFIKAWNEVVPKLKEAAKKKGVNLRKMKIIASEKSGF